MYTQFFGNYLLEKDIITTEQLLDALQEQSKVHLKLGTLAIHEGYMTAGEVDNIIIMQTHQDKKFGELAIEEGYLTEEQVGKLLKKQGDSYLLFVQALVERGLLTLEDIQNHLNHYKKSERYTALEIDALKSSDIDKIIQIFLKDNQVPMVVKDYLALLARNMVRFIDNKVRFERIERIHTYTSRYIASQCFTGDYNLFIGICNSGTKPIASEFAKEEFDVIDEDSLDAVCEFINVCNGLFASKESLEGVHIDMLPPEMYTDITTISSEGMMFVLPCYVHGERADIVVCMETKWNIG